MRVQRVGTTFVSMNIDPAAWASPWVCRTVEIAIAALSKLASGCAPSPFPLKPLSALPRKHRLGTGQGDPTEAQISNSNAVEQVMLFIIDPL